MPLTGAQQERFLSLTHVIDNSTSRERARLPDSVDEDDLIVDDKPGQLDSRPAGISLFAIATGEVTSIEPAGPLEARIYTGILRALQGQPKTREEVLGTLNLANDEERELAEAVFDAFNAYSFIVATGGLARVLAPTWMNSPVYPALGYENVADGQKDREPYAVTPGINTYHFTEQPEFERGTTRHFDPHAMVEWKDLQRMLVDSYRTSLDAPRPTPSPGSIYPVKLHIVNHGERVRMPEGMDLPNGVYQYDPNGLSLEQRSDFGTFGASMVEFLTDNPDATDAAVWLLMSVDTRAFEQKYGNASQVFLYTSAGLAMQRLIEEADRLGYGTLPLFGIEHNAGTDILHGEEDDRLVFAIGIGRPAEPEDSPDRLRQKAIAETLERVSVGIEGLVIDTGSVIYAGRADTGIPVTFYGTFAKYWQQVSNGEPIEAYAAGTATNRNESKLKAIAEALERMASGNVRVDREMVSLAELDGAWIDPSMIVPLDDEQRGLQRAQPFTSETKLNWTAGTSLSSGEPVYLPTSLVYYPYRGEERVGLITSNGVAAHFDRDEAIQRGLMELIERDAMMRAWIAKESPRRLDISTASAAIRYRVEELRANGRQVDILDMGEDSHVPTYLVTVRSDEFPHFYAGAAAGLDPERTLGKALDEATSGFMSMVVSAEQLITDDAAKRAEGVFDVASHGMLYATDQAMTDTLAWLYEGEPIPMRDRASSPTMDDLIATYEPVVFDMDNVAPGNELKIVRVVSPELLQIQFGNVGVPHTHDTLAVGTAKPEQHHFFS